MRTTLFLGLVLLSATVRAGELADQLSKLQLPSIDAAEEQLERYVSARLKAVNAKSSADWQAIKSKEQWEKYRAEKLALMRRSLGMLEKRPAVKVHVSGEHAGEGYVVKNVLYETRPHWFVTANLYVPAKPSDSMPGLLLSHSHHSPKTQGELQDMGATWARAGCYVLVPDHLGHGERRQHPFATAKDYDKEFPVSRQDYHFRYDNSLQLYLAGESLMGWMAHDLMGGVDVLLAQAGIAKDKIILLGGVAGGGDPAAVTAALDERIACAAPFNFGGPQPETRYPLPDDAETWFHYAGGGSWESTRNLADSAGDGFLPWVIVGSIAPRRLIYGHEFSWDRERDPVWKRFEQIWKWEDADDRLAAAHGRGTLRGNKPEDTHCGNIGAFHRRMIHPALDQWFGIKVTPESEYSKKLDSADLMCWTPELKEKLQPKTLRELLKEKTKSMVSGGAEAIMGNKVAERTSWSSVEGKMPPRTELFVTGTQPGLQARVLAIYPEKELRAAVIAVAQDGSQAFLKQRSAEIEELVSGGCAVCLADLRGTGVFAADRDRGPNSGTTSLNASLWMLGERESLLAGQLSDLRAVVDLATHLKGSNIKSIYLWGDSFAKPLPADSEFKYPRRVDRPAEPDTLGGLLALLGTRDARVAGAFVQGGLVSYLSVLDTPFVQVPQSTIIRGVLTRTDLPAIAAESNKPIRLESLVDGCGRLVDEKQLGGEYAKRDRLEASVERTSPAKWISSQVK
jgi:hypothetical protein